MISKELLSEVLGADDIKSDGIILDNSFNNTIAYQQGGNWNNWETINIHELAHKCKERAMDKGYYLCSFITLNGGVCDVVDQFSTLLKDFRNETTEPEAVFKAYQWTLDNEN